MKSLCASMRRILGLLIHFLYVYKRSPSFIINLTAWPLVNVLIWGFMNQYLSQTYGGQGFIPGTLVVGAVMWDVLMRANWETLSYIYDDYSSRTVAQLWSSPVRVPEHLAAVWIASVLPTLVSLTITSILVYTLFDFNILSLGPLLFAYLSLMMAFGFATATLTSLFIVRLGLSAANLIWFPVFVFASLSAIYYPLTALPPTLQKLALIFPPTHVMEHIRAGLAGHPQPLGDLLPAAGLAVVWLAVAMTLFAITLRQARRHGRLLNTH